MLCIGINFIRYENVNKLINTTVLVSSNIFDKIGPAVLENGYLYNNNKQSNFRSHNI